MIWLALIVLTMVTFVAFLLFNRSTRKIQGYGDPPDLRRADDGVNRDSPGETPSSFWPTS